MALCLVVKDAPQRCAGWRAALRSPTIVPGCRHTALWRDLEALIRVRCPYTSPLPPSQAEGVSAGPEREETALHSPTPTPRAQRAPGERGRRHCGKQSGLETAE